MKTRKNQNKKKSNVDLEDSLQKKVKTNDQTEETKSISTKVDVQISNFITITASKNALSINLRKK